MEEKLVEIPKAPAENQFETDIKLIKASLKLATFGASRWDARRNYEWKQSFGVWALLAAAALRGFTEASVLAGILIVFMYGSWLQGIWLRHSADANLTWHFVNEAQRLISRHGIVAAPSSVHLRIGGGKEPTSWSKWVGFITDWSLRFQFFITLGLTVIVYAAAADHVTLFKMTLRSGTH